MSENDKTQAAFDSFLQLWTTGTIRGRRAPVLRRPSEAGLPYENVTFPSMDGVPLEGWLIPANSNRLVIHNHFLPGNRYGYPGHLPDFDGLGGFEVNSLTEYQALHDAGYNVLCYDMRNHGLSGQGNGGITGMGLTEYRDVIGSLRFAASLPQTARMETVLLSAGLGANATAVGWARHPEEFSRVRALIMLQPVSGPYIVEEFVKNLDMPDGYAAFEAAVHERTSFHLAEQSALAHVPAITVPTLLAQVHDDTMTRPQDVQDIYDALGSRVKELHWIEGTDRRFDGYNYFGTHPEAAIDWFDRHLAPVRRPHGHGGPRLPDGGHP